MNSPAAQMAASGKMRRLPLHDIGMTNMVGVPVLLSFTEPLHTALRMGGKLAESIPAQYGFTAQYTINGLTAPAYEFLFGKRPSHAISFAIEALQHRLLTDAEGALKAICDPAESSERDAARPSVDPASLNSLPLDCAEQFAIGWTNYQGISEAAKPYLPMLASTLTDAGQATKHFWPILGTYSFGHNLLILQKVRESQSDAIKNRFGEAWSAAVESLYRAGRLYALDITILDCNASSVDDGSGRYAHATYTLLGQDAVTKALEPVAIWVSGKNWDGRARVYTPASATPGAWIYALQAVKASITVYAIWCRHAYIWHVIPGAMQMTMQNSLPARHPVYQFLQPQSKYTIAFNELLLMFWKTIAPPTSISKPIQFLRLANEFAKDRNFFDDDPKTEIGALGLREEDFSQSAPWDRYALVKDLLQLWDATEQYVDACVDAIYRDDQSVSQDASLQAWIAASSAPDQGNVRGLESLENRRALKRLLTSLLYRVLAHGGPNLIDPAILIHLFAPSFPPCLLRRDIPEPADPIDQRALMAYLPNTGMIGIIASFYFSFVIAKPYEPFVPNDGPEADLFFPGGLNDARNRALVAYRKALTEFVEARAVVPNQVGQWPLNIEI